MIFLRQQLCNQEMPTYFDSFVSASLKLKSRPPLLEFAISQFKGMDSSIIKAPPKIQKRMLGEICAKKFFVVKNYSTIFALFKRIASDKGKEYLENIEQNISSFSEVPKSPFLNPDFSIGYQNGNIVVLNPLPATLVYIEPKKFLTEFIKIIEAAAYAMKDLNEAGFFYHDPATGMSLVNKVWKLNLAASNRYGAQLIEAPSGDALITNQIRMFGRSFLSFIREYTKDYKPESIAGLTVSQQTKANSDIDLLSIFFEVMAKTPHQNISWDPIIDCFSDFYIKKLQRLRDQLL